MSTNKWDCTKIIVWSTGSKQVYKFCQQCSCNSFFVPIANPQGSNIVMQSLNSAQHLSHDRCVEWRQQLFASSRTRRILFVLLNRHGDLSVAASTTDETGLFVVQRNLRSTYSETISILLALSLVLETGFEPRVSNSWSIGDNYLA